MADDEAGERNATAFRFVTFIVLWVTTGFEIEGLVRPSWVMFDHVFPLRRSVDGHREFAVVHLNLP